MTSMQAQSPFDASRPQSHHGLHQTPHASPRNIARPVSQASVHHQAPLNYSPHNVVQPPMTAFHATHSQQFNKGFMPMNLSLPLPHQSYFNYPSTAPPVPSYPDPAPLWDATRSSQPMMRTISHAHPMNSATDHTASSRYSNSPHSITHDAPPPTAGGGYPAINVESNEARHVNPAAVFSYPMSRSTSGASDMQDYNTRLLTPHFEYRSLDHHPSQDVKISEPMSRVPSGGGRFFSGQPFGFDHGSIGPHPQPDFGTRGWGNDFAMSSERGVKVEINHDTDYERQRSQQIMDNKRLMEDMGLSDSDGGGGMFGRSRNISSGISSDRARKSVTPIKKRIRSSSAAIRSSPRLASLNRTSYANLDDGEVEEVSDEYDSEPEQDYDDEDEFRPTKRSKAGQKGYGRKASYTAGRSKHKVDLSLYGLLEVYAEIPHLFPLFYYTLNNDLTINCDSVPLIGSIPSTVTAVEKAEQLQNFFHRGRRVLGQLDAFTSRCDRKYDGEDGKWPELDYHTRIAIRDVRRKVVERCENYKYTRRDILDKAVGKGKWAPIENGMVEWKAGMTSNDPAGDLCNVTLTLPTPPPRAYAQHHQQPRHAFPPRQIRPIPSRSRVVSTAPGTSRILSVTMGEPDQYSSSIPMTGYGYSASGPPPPMYGEDEVSMTFQPQAQQTQQQQQPAMTPVTATVPAPVSAQIPSTPLQQSVMLSSSVSPAINTALNSAGNSAGSTINGVGPSSTGTLAPPTWGTTIGKDEVAEADAESEEETWNAGNE